MILLNFSILNLVKKLKLVGRHEKISQINKSCTQLYTLIIFHPTTFSPPSTGVELNLQEVKGLLDLLMLISPPSPCSLRKKISTKIILIFKILQTTLEIFLISRFFFSSIPETGYKKWQFKLSKNKKYIYIFSSFFP